MKEAFWGVLIIILGLFGIVIINIFQKSTVDNDRVYYLIKETSEAAAYDSIDLTYYRLNGDIRIVEDKFIENLTRRFAQNVTIGDYKIIVEDINEVPPKISLRVISQITSLQGENFNLKNRVDAVVEVKYKLEEVLDFLDITKEEWEERTNINIGIEGTEKVCEITIPEDTTECLTGDIKFSGFEGDKVDEKVCKGEQKKATKKAIYKVCECGKWKEYEKEIIAEPKEVGNEYVYTWEFKEKGELREIEEKLVERTKKDICTTGIEIWAPIPDEPPEPSEDNSKYEICGKEGIKIVIGKTKVLHPNYIPSNATNRNVTWSTSDESIVSIKASNPNNNTGYSRATITANKLGTIIITAETTLKQKATCKVEVIKDTIDSIGCSVSPRSIMTGSTGVIIPTYTPNNATNYNFEYSVSASSFVAEQAGYNTIRANYNGGSGSVTIKDTVSGKTGTCYFDVYEPAPDPDPGPSCTYFSCNLCEASTGKSCQMVNGCCEPVSSSGGSSGGNKCDYLSSGHCIGATGQSCTLDSNGCYVPNGPAYVNPPASGGGGAGCAHLKDIGMPCTKYQLN